MKKSNLTQLSRRDLLAKLIPACAITCVAPCKAFGGAEDEEIKLSQEVIHKFDTELEGKMTYRQLFQRQYYSIIEFGKLLKQELGETDAIELIKKFVC